MDKLEQTRIKSLIIVAAVALVMAVAFTSTQKASMSNVVQPAVNEPSYDAASDYTAQCAVCHGDDGRSQTTKGRKTHAADLTKSTVSDSKGIRMITNGSDEMPSFKKTMTADQIKDVMEYTHRFRPQGQ
jgi:mono/diheme cytochrome c family protein